MHGSIGSSCAVADVQADKATLWSATQSAYPDSEHDRDHPRTEAGRRARDLHARRRLLRHQRRRHRELRRRGAVAGGRQAGARAALAQGRDGVGELRQSLRHRPARRVSTRAARSSAWDYEAWSAAKGGRPGYNTPGNVVTGSLLGLDPAPFNPRTPAPAPATPLNNGLEHRAVVHRRTRRATRRTAPASCAASACCHTASGRRSSPGRCGRPSGCRTRSPTSASWTRSRRTSKPIRSRIGCGISVTRA